MTATEIGNDKRTGRTLVTTDGRYLRPLEVEQLRADSTKIHREIGWTSVDVADLACIMVRYDLAHTEYGHDDLVSDETIAQWRS
jgi:GDP-D-mannose dehydratase